MITTRSTINVLKPLKAGVNTSYTVDTVSLFMKHNGEEKRFNASDIVNSTTTTAGYISFATVPLWGDGSYSVYMTADSTTDLDTNGVILTKLATGYIKKITDVDTLSM